MSRYRRRADPDRKAIATRAAIALGTAALMTLGVMPMAHAAVPSTQTVDAEDAALAFDNTAYTTITVTIDGVATPVRWYKEVCYVADPVAASPNQTQFGQPITISNTACGYQSMNIFVPESAFDDQDTAIYFAVNNGGWFASYITASVTDGASYDSTTSNVGAALKAGYVFADVATRSRGFLAADGTWQGKAPAPVVDAKAAVRYLRLNDAAMPGSAERIVVNGTSGGGALVSILGASGNSDDYDSYLQAVGAAGIDSRGKSTIHDDVFAVNAYCPITDLGDADIAYEWLYTVLNTRETVGTDPFPAASAELAAKFPAYEQSLNLQNPDGSPLTADTMIATIQAEVKRSAEAYMQADPANVIPDLGQDFVLAVNGPPGTPPTTQSFTNDWIDVDNDANTVVSIDMAKYLTFVATQAELKPTPAFDQSGTPAPGTAGGPGTGESSLFGTPAQDYSNFTEYSWDHNIVAGDGVGLDDTGLTWAQFISDPSTVVDDQIHLINPMQYIGTKADTAPYWYVRNGTRDRDTSFIIAINLDRKLEADSSVRDVNFREAWNQPHAGNYDVPEAFAWIAASLTAADARLASVTVTARGQSQTVEPTGTQLAVTVPRYSFFVRIQAAPVAEGATVQAPRWIFVLPGRSRTVPIVVTSPDGGEKRTYTLTISAK